MNLTMMAADVRRWGDGGTRPVVDDVAVEMPIALEYNGVSFAVMLASPADLEDFALGFSLTEGIIARPRELLDLELAELEEGIAIKMTIQTERFAGLRQRRRNLAGRTGCGLCGAESLGQVFRPLPPVAGGVACRAANLQGALRRLRECQPLQQATGATHAAAWIAQDGGILLSREDVGRHNALDKMIGAVAAARGDFGAGVALVTSRASYELVQKAAAVGIGTLAAISAPTSLAIEMAERLNLTLVGFLRQGSHVVYTHPGRIHD